MTKNTHIITGVVKLCYLNVLEPRAMEGQSPRYSASILIDKTDKETLAAVAAGIRAAYEQGQSRLGLNPPPLKQLKTPLRDGDEERPEDPVYQGCYFFNASASESNPPQIIDETGNRLTSTADVYSGMLGRVSINFYEFNRAGNRGIAAGLCNILKVGDGERIGGGISAADDFAQYITLSAQPQLESKPQQQQLSAGSVFDEILSDGAIPF